MLTLLHNTEEKAKDHIKSRNQCGSEKICANKWDGDDFVLNFKNNDNNYSLSSSEVDETIYFFAAFDERLIYNAELYIDDGASDYNKYDQPEIKPFTYYQSPSSGIPAVYHVNAESESDAVAYSKGCQDSVGRFNDEMEEQKFILNYLISNDKKDQWGKTDYGDFGNSWTSTLAPDNEYEYYAWCKPAWGQPTSSEEYVAANYFNINGRRYIPYLPGWSFYLFNDEGFWVNALSAGVDCLGFVMRAAEYDYLRYYSDWGVLADHTVDNYDNVKDSKRVFPRQDHNCIERVVTSSNSSSNRAAVVPGGIFFILNLMQITNI